MLSAAPIDVTDAEQFAAFVGLVEREERTLLGEVDTTEADLVSQLTGPDAVPSAALAISNDGQLAGVALVDRIPQAREVVFDLRVDPEPQARHAVRAALLDHCLALAPTLAFDDERTPRESASSARWDADPGTWQIVTGIYDADTEGREALLERGLRHVRTFTRLRVEGAGTPGVAFRRERPIRNVTVRPVTSQADLHAAHLVTTESFAEHWGSAPRDYADWLALQRARPGHDETLWMLAELDGEAVGVCLMERSREPMGYGYVATLGVLPRMRRLGIADILLRTAIADSARRGLRGTELIVDSANSTGAGELYARAGMRPYRGMEVWLCPIGIV